MSLSITLTVNGKITTYDEYSNSIYFNDEADYWFLYPTLIKEIKNKTGMEIDLYDDCDFNGQNLIYLSELLVNFLNNLSKIKKERWPVLVGTQEYPVKKEIYKEVNKRDLKQKLEKFYDMVAKAIKDGESIICLGD